MKKQFVSTCYILSEEKFLLVFHKRYQKWLPPGGHLKKNETPPEAAKREVLEETGLTISFIYQENLWIDRPNAVSIERPFLCLLEEIPSYKRETSHQHIDFVFVGKPIGGELNQGKWFSKEEISSLQTDIEIFYDTQKIIEHISTFFLSKAYR